jgi:glycosyltransferase involved in cell wall biosynthesis
MRILLVAHNYPPAHTAGVEQHTAQVARELVRRGREVSVFCAEKDVSRAPGTLVERVHEGVRVTEFTNNLTYSDFRETWDFHAAESVFAEHLAREKPDVVHFQHLMYLSAGCVEAVARADAACVFTLHDYWLHCPRFGQRLHPDGSVCAKIEFARCGECMANFKFRQSALERSGGRWIAGLKETLGVDVSQIAKRTARRLGLAQPQDVAPAPERAAAMARELVARDEELRTRVLGGVQRLIAPSRFLLERMVEWGLPRGALELMRMGAEVDRFAAHPRPRAAGGGSGPLRVVFLGTFAPHKAPHLIVEAWRSLPSDLRAAAQLELFGSGAHYPDYVAALRRAADEAGVSVRAVLSRDGVASTLTSADLLVMPSVWWENAPLVLIEAVEARTPILVSDLGGMAEFVHERPCGATFEPGNSADLSRALAELLGDRARLAQFYASGPKAPTMADNVARMEQIYAEAVGERRAAR